MPLQIPFLLHALIELPASLKFFFNPSSGLITHTQTVKTTKSNAETLSPEVVLVIRQYAILLFTSVLISASFATREPDSLSRWVGGCLGLYHIGPIWRAIWRISRDNTLRITRHDMGGPVVHLGPQLLYRKLLIYATFLETAILTSWYHIDSMVTLLVNSRLTRRVY